MGADGGTIPTRGELTKLKKQPEKADKDQLAHAKWFTCAVSHLPLKEPIVCDEVGRLYNKTDVIEAIVNKTLPPALSYITSLKDLSPVKFQPNPKFVPSSASALEVDKQRYHCPISLLPVNGFYAFSAQRGCGCVVSDKAVREVNTPECINCGHPRQGVPITTSHGTTTTSYAIQLNPGPDDASRIQDRVIAAKAAQAAERKAAKAAKKAAKGMKKSKDTNGIDSSSNTVGGTTTNGIGKRKRDKGSGDKERTLQNVKKAATAAELKPEGADSAVWSKLFTSSQKGEVKETFLCRSVQHQLYKS